MSVVFADAFSEIQKWMRLCGTGEGCFFKNNLDASWFVFALLTFSKGIMLHFRIVGAVWLTLCLIAAAVLGVGLLSMASNQQYGFGTGFYDLGFWISEFSAEGFLLVGALLGVGLLRLKRWAAIGTRVTAFLLLLYCLSFALMSDFVLAWLIAGCFGFAFSAYSLFVVWKFRPYTPKS
jgi:hypothetical protein